VLSPEPEGSSPPPRVRESALESMAVSWHLRVGKRIF